MSNEYISGEYWKAAIAFGGSWETYKKHKRAIADCEVDIVDHYAEHGSLEGLKIRGVGQWAITGILEPVLREGAEEFREDAQAGRDASLSWKVSSKGTISGKVSKRHTRWKD